MTTSQPRTIQKVVNDIQDIIFRIESIARVTSLSMHTTVNSDQCNIQWDVTHLMDSIVELTKTAFDHTESLDFGIPQIILDMECQS